MNRNSLLLAGGIIALILLGALASAIVPSLGLTAPGGGEGGSVASEAPAVEAEPIIIHMNTMPEFVPESMMSEDGSAIELNPWLAIGALGAIVIGGLAVVGAGIAFASTFLEKTTVTIKESDEFKQGVNAIQTEEKARLKEMNTQAPTFSMKEEDYEQPRWSVISTGALILLFVSFTAIAISDTFYPEGEMMMGGEMMSAPSLFMGIAALVTVALMVAFFRPRTLNVINGKEEGAIPWDTIYILVTGFIFVVAGVGLIIWLRHPVG